MRGCDVRKSSLAPGTRPPHPRGVPWPRPPVSRTLESVSRIPPESGSGGTTSPEGMLAVWFPTFPYSVRAKPHFRCLRQRLNFRFLARRIPPCESQRNGDSRLPRPACAGLTCPLHSHKFHSINGFPWLGIHSPKITRLQGLKCAGNGWKIKKDRKSAGCNLVMVSRCQKRHDDGIRFTLLHHE